MEGEGGGGGGGERRQFPMVWGEGSHDV